MELKKYAVSVGCKKRTEDIVYFNHNAIAIEAYSEEEAIGHAIKAMEKTNPRADGWADFNATACEFPK